MTIKRELGKNSGLQRFFKSDREGGERKGNQKKRNLIGKTGAFGLLRSIYLFASSRNRKQIRFEIRTLEYGSMNNPALCSFN